MMARYPYLDVWLQCLQQLAPPTGLVHVGAGGGRQPYPFGHLPRVLAAEAHGPLHAHLQAQLATHTDSQVFQAVLADRVGNADFHTLSQSQESGLCPAATWLGLWPNLQTLQTDVRPTTTLHALLTQAPAGPEAYNWAMIDCLPADQILHGAGDLLYGWDVLVLRALQAVPADASHPTQAMGLAALRAQVAPFGLQWVALQEENHPNLVRALFVRNPTEHKRQWAEQLRAQAQQTVQYQSALASLQAQQACWQQDLAQLGESMTALTQAQDQLAQDKAALSLALDTTRDECAQKAAALEQAQATLQELESALQTSNRQWQRQQSELKQAEAHIALIQGLLDVPPSPPVVPPSAPSPLLEPEQPKP